jgi:hypothetical protein
MTTRFRITVSEPDPFFDEPRRQAPGMGDLGKEIAARFKETYYAYQWRQTPDNRSAQPHVGPSEVGTPCDRRLAMSLMRIPPVHAGGEGWPAFIGTCVHAGLADMFLWSGGGSNRYLVEVPLLFSSEHMPRGTGDLIDRTLHLMIDHKVLGRWSLNNLKANGPSDQYRVQLHLYAHAARSAGESIKHVVLVAWPREGRNLDDMYVWTEEFNPGIVKDAFQRLDMITGQIALAKGEDETPLETAKRFDTQDDCRFCPFRVKGDTEFIRGCPGHQRG